MKATIFHISERGAYAEALENGAYAHESLGREGFVHCSTGAQVVRTADRFFAGRNGLVLLCIDADELGERLKFEPADGESFPHCYGVIPLSAIRAVLDFPCRYDGRFELPDEVRLLTTG